nr:MAG TPA: Baseplate J like protein [Herelleviridae sp.]
MITKTSATITNLKNLFIEMFLDKTAKVSNVADGSVVNATAFGVAKVAQKAMKDIAIKEAQIFPDTATGVYLDKAAALYGVSPRKGALGSSTYIRVSANPGTVYDTSVTFVNKNGIRFQVDEALTVGKSGYGYVKVRSINAGYSTNVPPNSITNVSPQPQGHIECTNEYYAIGGRDSEDDETFRIRIKNNLNTLSKNTIEYWTQTLSNIDDRVLKVMSAGLDEKGIYNLYVVSQNGIFFTEEELDTLLESAQGYFGISELNIEGKVVGIGIKNIDWFYVGSERGLDFRVQLQPDYDVSTVRQNIQVNLTKYLDFRFWTPGKIVEWDDLLDIVKKTDGVKYVPDEYFFPYYDQQVPANQLPRIRGFVMRDQDGNILYDSDSNLSPLFYPSEPEDLFVGINDSSLNLYQEVYFNVTDSEGGTVEGANISIGNNAVITNDNGQAIIQLANGQYEYIVSASGYIPVEGMFVVLNGSVSIDVQMVLAPYTVTFHVTDEKGGVVPHANVMMDNRTTTTNLQGVASLSARNGSHPYTIEKLGYDEYSGSVVVDGRDKEVYPELEFKVWTITVIVKDKENQLIPNVIVKVNNGEYLTNQHGEAEIPLVNGEYPVTIEKTGYDTLQGEIKVNNQNADVTFEMDFFLYNVEFNISQVNQGNPAEGATIKIEGQPGVLNVNGSGQATIKLKSGNYSYTVQKKGYDDLTGSFNVEGQDTFIQRTLVLKHYNVVITVLDSDNSSPTQGAAVNINGSSYPTNERGQAVVSLQNGTYPYTVTKSGYYDGSSSVTVLDSDNSSVISLKVRLYNVIMTVKNPLKEPIKGATVEINTTSYQTQDNGEVSLQLKNGTYPFTVVANGMDDYLGELEVVSADIPSFPVNMEYKKYDIVFTVQTDEGVAIENANIHINEKDYQTSQGGLVTVCLSDGQYPYTVTKEGYVQTQGNVEVSGSNKNVLAQLTPTSCNITFVVKDNMASPNLLQGVSIDIENEDKTVTTNASGEAIISLKAGKYTASFMKNSYKTETLSFEVTGEATFTQILKKIWNLTFKVTAARKSGLKDVTVSVSGPAMLSGNTVSLKTKDDGTTDPVQVINGAYDWNASLTGYSPEEGVGSIQDADQQKVIELTYGFETTFTTSPATQGVEITIDGNDTITTGQDGIATINLSTGTHTYAYSKTGFLNGTGNVRIEEAEKSVRITLVPGATVTFHTKVGNSALADVKIIVGQSSAGALPETIVTNSQGIAAIDLPTGDYQYQIPTTSTDNPNLVEVPSGTFSVATAASAIELDLADYVKYNVTFQTVPSTQDVAISFAKAESPDTPVASGATASNGILTLTYKNGQYIYTAKKSSYKDVTGEFTIAGGDQNITVEILQISTVTFTVKSQNDSSPIENVVIEMTDRSDSSNKYKGTTNSSGVATMTFDGGEFEWSQDSDADFSSCPVFQEDEKYLVPADGVTTDQLKTYFPNGVIVSPLTIVQDKDNSGITESLTRIYNSNKIDGWEGSWDKTKKNLTLTSVIKTSTASTETYVLFNVDAGLIGFSNGLFQIGTEKTVDYHKALDFGFKVSGVPSNLKIVITYGSQNAPLTVEMENDVIQRFQLSDLLLDTETIGNSTIWSVHVQSFDGGTLSADDLKDLNITFSFYGKKAISSDIPADKVLYGNYDYTVTPPSPLKAQSGMLNVNAPAINKEILIVNNVDVTFKVTAKQPLLTRPQIGDFVYGDKTWSTELDSGKTCVGVITDVRSKDFDFISLQNVDAAIWTQTLDIISNVVTETDESLALCDFAGKTNSQNNILAKPTESTAAHKCAAYSTEGFGAGSWFLPSCGQWGVAQLNRVKIDTSISATIGSDPLSSGSYWTSTQYNSNEAWIFDWVNGTEREATKNNSYMVRPFCTYEYNPVPNGVYIYDKDNNRYTKEEWVSSGKGVSAVCGIGISTDTNSFMVSTAISAQSYSFGGQGTLISNVPMLNTNVASTVLYKSTHGFIYTDVIISQLRTGYAPTAEYAKTYMFGNGQNGYLPSYGEVITLYSYRTQVEEILRMLDLSLWGSVPIQTCTQYRTRDNIIFYWLYEASVPSGKGDEYKVLPFTLLPSSNPAIPIENALVKMTSASNNYQQNTNNNGEAVIFAALGVDYDYEVSADGYTTQNGKVGVLNEAKTIEVTLQPASELTVVVHRNTLDGATDVSGVQVVVTENKEGGVQMVSGTTSQNGTVVLFVPYGSYKVAFSKDGFESKEETVEVNGKTALNTFLLQIYNTINVQVRRVGQMQGMPSQIQLKDSTGLEVIQTKNITTTVTFANVAYGQYILYVPEGDFSKETSQSITVNSEGMQVQVNLTPLYMVQVKVNPTGGNVKFTDSEGQKHTGSAGPATYTARFDKIPAGNYQIKITSSGFSDFSTTGSISGVYQTSVNLEYTLHKPNKLVQITSNQSNYQLDTSYKYVSLLIVGRGGEKFGHWQSWDEFALMGGTTGQIVYIPNILISDISNGRINKITFSSIPNIGGYTEGTEYSIRLGVTTYECKAYNGSGSAYNDANYPMPQGSRLNNYSVYNAKSSGGLAAHKRSTFYCSGSPGSQNAKEESASNLGPRMQPDGAPGGDGRYGYKSSYEKTVFGKVTKPIQSSVVIPVQSIFGGTSKGAAGYLNTKSGERTGASAWGGAGYGGSFYTSSDGGKTRIAGYGSGQECSPADDDAGNITKPGEGIFCIYYHNEPI